MPARILPDKTKLRSLVDSGMSQQEIVDWIERETGAQVSRSSVASALSRAGLTEPILRYKEELPWRVRSDHLKHYAARMLRLLGRHRAGLPLTQDQRDRLNAWLDRLRDDGAVVVYLYETEEGFHYVGGNWDKPDLPIKAKITTV